MTAKSPPRDGAKGAHGRWTPPASAVRVPDVSQHSDARSLIAGLSSALQDTKTTSPAAPKGPAETMAAPAGGSDELRGFVCRFVTQEDEFHFG